MRRFLFFALSSTGIALTLAACSLNKRHSVEPVVVETLVSATKSWNGDSFQYPRGKAQVTLQRIIAQPGFKTPLHLHAQPGVAYVTKGQLSCETIDGRRLIAGEGESFATPQNTIHFCENTSQRVAIVFVAVAGIKGQETTTPFNK